MAHRQAETLPPCLPAPPLLGRRLQHLECRPDHCPLVRHLAAARMASTSSEGRLLEYRGCWEALPLGPSSCLLFAASRSLFRRRAVVALPADAGVDAGLSGLGCTSLAAGGRGPGFSVPAAAANRLHSARRIRRQAGAGGRQALWTQQRGT